MEPPGWWCVGGVLRGSVSHLAGCGSWWVAGARWCFGFGVTTRNAPAKFLPALAHGRGPGTGFPAAIAVL